MNKKAVAGVLAAIMAVSSSFISLADSVGVAPGAEATSENSSAVTAGSSESEVPVQSSTVIVGGSESEAPAQSSTVIVGGSESEAPAQSSTVIVGGSETEVPAQSTTVTAGSSTVTAGGSNQSSIVIAGGSQGAGPSVNGAAGVSGVVEAGSGGSRQMGPGMGGIPVSTGISGGVDGFAGTVQNPIVQVMEKYTYDQMCRDIENLSSRYGDRMRVNIIGTTHDGRNLYEVIVGNPDAGKHVLIHAGIHGREYMTPLLVMKQMEYGLAFYDSGSFEGRSLSDMFQQVAIHYVPMVNPDGISISQSGLGAIRSESLRQQIQQSYANDISLGRTSAAFDRYLLYWKANGRGVDLNQNFPANWELVISSSLPSYGTYKGPGPVSEPESQALVNLINSRIWSATISYHSMGNLIYWDYAGNAVQAQSLDLANTISGRTGYWLAGSSGHGGFKDWLQIRENPVPSLTLEVGGVACPMPVTEFTDVWNRNRDVWALLMKWALEH